MPVKKQIDLFSRLSPVQRRLLAKVRRAADSLGVAAYLVGGPVRDALLGRKAGDLDVAVEGDASALARRLALGSAGRVTVHPQFNTARVDWPDGLHLDIAGTRTETYAAPAALPCVAPATIQADLLRRDFSVNALAVFINTPRRGELLDEFGGVQDLKLKRLRILHLKSFKDDPTRIFRAVRFSCRLGFRLEPQTKQQALAVVKAGLIRRLSPARLGRELELIWQEPDPFACLERLADLGVLRSFQPGLGPVPKHRIRQIKRAFGELDPEIKSKADFVQVMRLAWVDSLPQNQVRRLSERVFWPARVKNGLLWQKRREGVLMKLLVQVPAVRPSALAAQLTHWPLENLIWLRARLGRVPAGRRICDFLRLRAQARPLLSGRDLITLGFKPGPAFERIFRSLENARWDRRGMTRAREIQFVLRHFKKG